MAQHPALQRLILYTRKSPDMIAFYSALFGYTAHQAPDDRIIELRPPGPGAILMLHPMARGQKSGQAQVKLVFDVNDVPAFCAQAEKAGYPFGKPFRVEGYAFANAKDPADNSVSVSSRAFADMTLTPLG